MNQIEFNELFRNRTKYLALAVIKMYGKIPKNDETRIMGRQLMRSASSVTANYRAVCRARSERERFAKLPIVVEEADENLFWLELLEKSNLTKFDFTNLKKRSYRNIKSNGNYQKKIKTLKFTTSQHHNITTSQHHNITTSQHHDMKALILVDLQNDFCPFGALPVPKGNEVIPLANQLMPYFDVVVATQDWHPADHGSFAANHYWRKPGQVIELNGLSQILWPIHCVQGSFGAEFVNGLETEKIDKVFPKGTDARIDSYSGFFDNGHLNSTGLGDYLKEKGANEVFVMGLAADYCVKFTALDAIGLGFKTYLIEDATRGVNMQEDDTSKAFQEMKDKGIIFTTTKEILKN